MRPRTATRAPIVQYCLWNINGVSGALLSHTTEAADETGGHHVDDDNAGVAEVTTKEKGNGVAPMWAQGVRAST